jgi:hypothetical protein
MPHDEQVFYVPCSSCENVEAIIEALMEENLCRDVEVIAAKKPFKTVKSTEPGLLLAITSTIPHLDNIVDEVAKVQNDSEVIVTNSIYSQENSTMVRDDLIISEQGEIIDSEEEENRAKPHVVPNNVLQYLFKI